MSILLPLLATGSTIFGSLAAYFLDKKKHKKSFRFVVVMTGFCIVTATWLNYFFQARDFTSIQKRFDEIVELNDSLKTQINEMSEKLEPFMRMARASYPALGGGEALTKLAIDISKILAGMQPKIIPLSDKTKSWKDSNTNLIHTIYYFRSQYPVAVRDISITMKFDRTLLRAEWKITGAFVVEQGSRMMINADSRGFTFVTGLLGVGNDIMIEVISNEPLKITLMQLFPNQ